MSISEIYQVIKTRPQIPITKSTSFKMSNQTYDSRKYPCPICQKRFKARNHLEEHMTLHSGELRVNNYNIIPVFKHFENCQ